MCSALPALLWRFTLVTTSLSPWIIYLEQQRHHISRINTEQPPHFSCSEASLWTDNRQAFLLLSTIQGWRPPGNKGSLWGWIWDHPDPLKITCWKISKYWNYCVPFRELFVDLTIEIDYQKKASLQPKRKERTTVEGSQKECQWNKLCTLLPFYQCLPYWPFASYLHIFCLIEFRQPSCEIVINTIPILKISKLRFSDVTWPRSHS